MEREMGNRKLMEGRRVSLSKDVGMGLGLHVRLHVCLEVCESLGLVGLETGWGDDEALWRWDDRSRECRNIIDSGKFIAEGVVKRYESAIVDI